MMEVPGVGSAETLSGVSAAPGPGSARSRRRKWTRVLTAGAVVVALAIGVLARLHSSSALWLDEALSVNIAALPPSDLLAALRQDGSPPLYYLALHAWIDVLGSGDGAVRALSCVFSLAALPVAYVLGRRLGGRPAARAALVVFAANPFLVRYATETRMYSLVVLLTLLAILCVLRARDVASWPRLVAVAVTGGALALTHYWTGFFLAATALVLGYRAVRGPDPRNARRVVLALSAGAVLFLPWAGSFLYQFRHTGTPWSDAAGPLALVDTARAWAGGSSGASDLAWAALVALVALGAVRPSVASGAFRAVPRRGRQATSLLLAGSLGALAAAIVASLFLSSGYAVRYSSAMIAPALLLAAVGIARLRPAWNAAALAVTVGFGVLGIAQQQFPDNRTQAAQTASALNEVIRPDDVIVYCPDQLGPAVHRLISEPVAEVVYPTLAGPERIDWVDYADRNAAANPAAIARTISDSYAGRIWLVTAQNYRTFDRQCEQLSWYLDRLRGARTDVQHTDGAFYEQQGIVLFPTPTSSP